MYSPHICFFQIKTVGVYNWLKFYKNVSCVQLFCKTIHTRFYPSHHFSASSVTSEKNIFKSEIVLQKLFSKRSLPGDIWTEECPWFWIFHQLVMSVWKKQDPSSHSHSVYNIMYNIWAVLRWQAYKEIQFWDPPPHTHTQFKTKKNINRFNRYVHPFI